MQKLTLIANEHAAKYDPSAVRERPICSSVLARKSGARDDVCWDHVANPAKVSSTSRGFAVAMRSADPESAREIQRRARLLIETP